MWNNSKTNALIYITIINEKQVWKQQPRKTTKSQALHLILSYFIAAKNIISSKATIWFFFDIHIALTQSYKYKILSEQILVLNSVVCIYIIFKSCELYYQYILCPRSKFIINITFKQNNYFIFTFFFYNIRQIFSVALI